MRTARSGWRRASRRARAPALRGRIVTDVAIVGGGFTGVSTAWHLRRRSPGLGIALLEARQLGHGASGRNGGQVLNWINGVTPETPEAARRIHGATRAGIDLAEELATRYAPPGTFRRQRLSRGLHRSASRRGGAASTPKSCARPGSRSSSCPAPRSA